jgi:hypothetical protein
MRTSSARPRICGCGHEAEQSTGYERARRHELASLGEFRDHEGRLVTTSDVEGHGAIVGRELEPDGPASGYLEAVHRFDRTRPAHPGEHGLTRSAAAIVEQEPQVIPLGSGLS